MTIKSIPTKNSWTIATSVGSWFVIPNISIRAASAYLQVHRVDRHSYPLIQSEESGLSTNLATASLSALDGPLPLDTHRKRPTGDPG